MVVGDLLLVVAVVVAADNDNDNGKISQNNVRWTRPGPCHRYVTQLWTSSTKPQMGSGSGFDHI